ncbi:MAG: hypothetical protein L0Z50_32360 [Verrucomicrobiales bacterium]|nr:hypothetical protein [Verrucomicrobiales bacterium]
MKRTILLWLTLAYGVVTGQAAIPAAEQLLPADTIVVVNVPDSPKALAYFSDSPQGKLWADPAMKSFRESFAKRFGEDVLGPIEKELGLKFNEYKDLARGQLTFALTQNGWDGKSDNKFGWIFLLDTKDKSEQLKTQLTALKTKWVNAGRVVRTDRLRDTECMTLVGNEKDWNQALQKAFPRPAIDSLPDAGSEKKGNLEQKSGKYEISFAQAESLLIVGNVLKDIEKVVARIGGATLPTLAEQGSFERNRGLLFRDALGFAWLNFQPIYQVLSQQYGESAKLSQRESLMAPRMDKILAVSGLAGLKSVALKVSGGVDGSFVEAFLSVPESSRQGLFKAFTLEAKQTSPPGFIPADTVKFSRWRVNGQKVWTTFESMLTSISPEMAGVLQLGFATIGKDKDSNFDLKKNLIGNLGDDFIFYERRPPLNAPADATSPPSITLIASPHTDQLVQALKASTSLLPVASADLTVHEREFLGRRIYSVPLPDAAGFGTGQPLKRSFNFAGSGGYVALSTDAGLVEAFLRSAEGTGKSLRETAGLAEAAQKVGGMNSGYFGFENQAESMRASFENLKNESAMFDKMLAANPVTSQADLEEARKLKGWFDFSLLPAFDRVAPYFHFLVYGLSSTSEGLSWKLFAPTPPQLPTP